MGSGVIMFLLYKLYFLSPNPKTTPHSKLQVVLDLQKTSFCMIYKLVSKNVPTRSKFTCITILVGTFGPYKIVNIIIHTRDVRYD